MYLSILLLLDLHFVVRSQNAKNMRALLEVNTCARAPLPHLGELVGPTRPALPLHQTRKTMSAKVMLERIQKKARTGPPVAIGRRYWVCVCMRASMRPQSKRSWPTCALRVQARAILPIVPMSCSFPYSLSLSRHHCPLRPQLSGRSCSKWQKQVEEGLHAAEEHEDLSSPCRSG